MWNLGFPGQSKVTKQAHSSSKGEKRWEAVEWEISCLDRASSPDNLEQMSDFSSQLKNYD